MGRAKEIKEKFLTGLIFTGIFLPVRLIFYTYVSQYWIGSFGLMTACLLSLLYLSNKNKLGYVGYLVNKHTASFAKGNFGKFSMIYLVFSAYLFGLAIYGIEHPPEQIKAQIVSVLNDTGIHDLNTATSKSNQLSWTGPGAAYGVLFSFIVLFVPSKLSFTIYSILNDYTHGWMLHFATVFFVEQLEILGLVIYFRYWYKEKDINNC